MMSAAVLTPQEYLARERSRRREEGMYEYIQGNLIEMGGASRIHVTLCMRIAAFLMAQAERLGLEVYQSDLRVSDVQSAYFYPDLVIAANPPVFQDDTFDTLVNPLLIVEVLSDTTEAYDRGEKFERYRSIPSLQEYVLVSQKKPLIESYYRTDEGHWAFTAADLSQGSLLLRSVDLSLPLAEVYRKVTFA